jgi:fatty acid desaturase
LIPSDLDTSGIPESLNAAILLAAAAASWALLWAGSHASWPWALLAAWAFAFVHHTGFSLLHEAVHGTFSRKRRRNDAFGVACAAMFPTSFTLQRIAHLGHHRRNRTDEDLYDYYLPTQSRTLRNVWLYAGNLCGLYWFCIPLNTLIFLLAPWAYGSRWFSAGPARYLGFEHHVKEIAQHSKSRIWAECLLAFCYQAILWRCLDLNLRGWLLCYWAFALHWSALQYVDHAWSPRDVLEGAWNLRVSAPAKALLLNYTDHLAHHRQPQVSWIHLPKLVDPTMPRPTFWKIYFSLWGGVRPAPPMAAQAAAPSGDFFAAREEEGD